MCVKTVFLSVSPGAIPDKQKNKAHISLINNMFIHIVLTISF